ncbi:hypothetical protein ONS95_004626 [Cadophora gregata]|uniref:uncharacterized protein n=1 Tax=Cadophora gregata TaxID=51156 RepID=UPI0026DD888C|nr:uncharacterized protein ONS95_004626 [Cadophora gregata]KAK0105004.1 hypothetical protein ONS96_004412 [Cadophora gregata f. sp. sojae]KAK0106124.1 hypothetical protein ONS95_004626 [Cadophora gregata]
MFFFRTILLVVASFLFLGSAQQDASSTAAITPPPSTPTPPPASSETPVPNASGSQSSRSSSRTVTSATSVTTRPSQTGSTAPDVHLNVPNLSVGKIELMVENLAADINLNAQVANLVTINAGVAVSVQKINVTISDVEVKLELIVRLGHLVDIVDRVFKSLDLNPLLIDVLRDVTSIVTGVIGAVDGLLGSITGPGGLVNFVIDNLGNIVQSTVGTAGNTIDQIVGNYKTNMTETGVIQQLGNGQVKKQFLFPALGTLVDIVFNAAGQILQATAVKPSSTGGAGVSSTAAPASSSTPMPVVVTTPAASATPAAPSSTG